MHPGSCSAQGNSVVKDLFFCNLASSYPPALIRIPKKLCLKNRVTLPSTAVGSTHGGTDLREPTAHMPWPVEIHSGREPGKIVLVSSSPPYLRR
jgi:hypothetical protein